MANRRPESPPYPTPRVLVIGAGIVGSACALRLQQALGDVLLLDADATPTGASWGNAGHIAIEQVEPLASLATVRGFARRLFPRGALALPHRDVAAWLPFAWRLLRASMPARFAAGRTALGALLAEAMPAWRRLAADAGAGALLREDGHLVAWESEASAAAGRARWKAADIGTARVRDATPEELARLASLTSASHAGAVRFEGSGQVTDLAALAERLADRFAAAGGTRRTARAARLLIEDGRAVALLEDGERIAPELLLVAAGAFSAALFRSLGHRVPLIAERGYHIQSAGSGWPDDMPPVVFEDRSMIVTGFRAGLRAASFVEYSRIDSPPDPRKWARLRHHVATLGLPFRLPGSEWVGARPTLPDYLPAIGRGRRAANLLYAFGHQHLGLTLAAVTADAIAALALGDAPAVPLAPFDLGRFGVEA